MSRKRSRAALESHRVRFVEGAGRQRRRREGRRSRLRQARRLLRLRLPEVACRRVRAARLPVAVAAPPLSGRVPLLAAERPADGLLPAGEPRSRRAAARGGGALARREPERGAGARSTPAAGACDESPQAPQAVRIGLAYVQSVGEDDAAALVAERDANGPYRDVGDLARRAPALEGRARGARRGRRLRRARPASVATCSGSSASPPGRPPSPGTQGAAKQLTLSLDPTAATPELRDLTRWERMAADYRAHGPLGRRPSAHAAAPASAGGNALERRAARRAARLDGSPTPGSRSRGSGPRPRTASSSCCSRTSAARST